MKRVVSVAVAVIVFAGVGGAAKAVRALPPTVRSVLPNAAQAGVHVTIAGTHLSGATLVAFGGTPAVGFTVVSDASISAAVPVGARSGPIMVVTRSGIARSGQPFTVLPPPAPPVVASFFPGSGSRGASITLRGSGFTGTTSVRFGGAAATFKVLSDTTIAAVVPAGAATGDIAVATAAGVGTSTSEFTLLLPAGSPGAPPQPPTAPSPPLNVGITLDQGNAITFLVSSAGATLTEHDNGTTYSFAIPQGAVPDGTSITMTPIASISGAPASATFAGGVKLEPSGLQLAQPAILTVTPAHPVSLKTAVGFGFEGSGTSFQYALALPTSGSYEIPVMHFSGAGLISDSSTAAAPPSGGDASTQWMYDIKLHLWGADQLDQEADKLAIAHDCEKWTDYLRISEAPTGMTTDAGMYKVLADMYAAWHDCDLLVTPFGPAFSPPTTEEFGSVAGPMIEAAYNRHQQACVTNKDPREVEVILRLDRLAIVDGDPGWSPSVERDEHCLRFEVDFESNDRWFPMDVGADATRLVPDIHGDSGTNLISGTGTLSLNDTIGTETYTEPAQQYCGRTLPPFDEQDTVDFTQASFPFKVDNLVVDTSGLAGKPADPGSGSGPGGALNYVTLELGDPHWQYLAHVQDDLDPFACGGNPILATSYTDPGDTVDAWIWNFFFSHVIPSNLNGGAIDPGDTPVGDWTYATTTPDDIYDGAVFTFALDSHVGTPQERADGVVASTTLTTEPNFATDYPYYSAEGITGDTTTIEIVFTPPPWNG